MGATKSVPVSVYIFPSEQEAREYKAEHSIGGWLFIAEKIGTTYLFSHHFTPSQIMRHPILFGLSGKLDT